MADAPAEAIKLIPLSNDFSNTAEAIPSTDIPNDKAGGFSSKRKSTIDRRHLATLAAELQPQTSKPREKIPAWLSVELRLDDFSIKDQTFHISGWINVSYATPWLYPISGFDTQRILTVSAGFGIKIARKNWWILNRKTMVKWSQAIWSCTRMRKVRVSLFQQYILMIWVLNHFADEDTVKGLWHIFILDYFCNKCYYMYSISIFF